jgi:hypothetical protein
MIGLYTPHFAPRLLHFLMKNTTFQPCKAAKKWMKFARPESFDFFAGGTSVGVCSLIAAE